MDILNNNTFNQRNESKIINTIFDSYYQINNSLNKICKSHQLTLEQFFVLQSLNNQDNELSMGSLQSAMLPASCNYTRIVDKLVDKGLVKRNHNPNNKRVILIKMTKTGEDVFQVLLHEIEQFENNYAKNLSLGELLHLNQLLEKYIT